MAKSKAMTKEERRSHKTRPVYRRSSVESEQLFIAEYQKDFNGTRAYMAVFPHAKKATATVQASLLLRRPNVIAALKEKVQDRVDDAIMEVDEWLREVSLCARTSAANYGEITPNGQFKTDLRRASTRQLACIQEIQTEDVFEGLNTEDEEPVAVRKTKIKLVNKKEYLDLLGRYHKLLTDKHELGGIDGKPLVPPSVTVNFRGTDGKKEK